MDFQLPEQAETDEQTDTVSSETYLMEAPIDLYSFGNKTEPRGARPIDFKVASLEDEVGPENPPLPKGASNVTDVSTVPLTGHYHKLAAKKALLSGLGLVADGKDKVSGSKHMVGHHTIFPTKRMKLSAFNILYKALEWEYGGKK